MPLFNAYTPPSEATTYELGSDYESHGNLTTQRNNWTVDWTRRKWYRLGYLWNADFSAIQERGLWVLDLDDLDSFEWLPFDLSSHNPIAVAGFFNFVGLTAFEGTEYAAVAATYGSTGVRHLLLNLETGKFLASATASAAATADNIENSPFLLPTADANVWHRFDVSRTATANTSRWAVIEYDLSEESATVLVNYELAPVGLRSIEDKVKCKGQTGSTFNTVFCINPDADDGRIFEVTIPHNTTSVSDLSFEVFKTVTVPSGHAVSSVFYVPTTDTLVYAYRKRATGAAPWFIRYEAVSRESPESIIWSTAVDGDTQGFSAIHESSYQHYRVTGCTCIDFLESNVIDCTVGTVTKLDDLVDHASVQGTRYNLIDMQTNKVWGSFKDNKVTINADFIDNDFQWPGDLPPEDEEWVSFVQAYSATLNMLYPSGACLLTGISFGEEKDPLYVDFRSFDA